LRFAIGIYLFVLLFYYNTTNGFLVVSLFLVGAFTDMLDGSIARGLNMKTKLGAIIDPIADRFLVIPIVIYALVIQHFWLFFAMIVGEIINGLASVYSQGKGVFVESNIYGKVKMVLQCLVFIAMLFYFPEPPNMFFIYMLWFSVGLLIVSVIYKFIEIRTIQHENL